MSFDVDPRDNRQQFACDCGGNISQVADHYECDACAFDSRNLKCDRCIEKNDAIAERDARIERLKRACSVLYFGSEDYLRKLAENAYSSCAKTQTELKDLLEGK